MKKSEGRYTLAVRADASFLIGTGHIMRCMALSDVMRQKGCRVFFICREYEKNLIALIEKKGFEVKKLPCPPADAEKDTARGIYGKWLGCTREKDAKETLECIALNTPDFLIVDHYGLDAEWESRIKKLVPGIMAIDDIADRKHDCDILFDQNFYLDAEERYKKLVPQDCIKLLGPEYALLRKEFSEAGKNLRHRDGSINRIMIFFGGSDPTNETCKVLEAVSKIGRDIQLDVVTGSANPHRETVERICSKMKLCQLHFQVDNMSELMNAADLAIGAGGSTTWERCCMGLPALVAVLAENQRRLSEDVETLGPLKIVGWGESLTSEDYLRCIKELTPEKMLKMSEAGKKLVSGNGCEKVADTIFKIMKV